MDRCFRAGSASRCYVTYDPDADTVSCEQQTLWTGTDSLASCEGERAPPTAHSSLLLDRPWLQKAADPRVHALPLRLPQIRSSTTM